MNWSEYNLKKSKRKILILTPIILILIALISFLIWANDYYKSTSKATAALKSDKLVAVTQKEYIVFKPADKKISTALIFYPGGKVDEKAYAPLCRKIASNGYMVVIVPMPLHFAIFGENKASDVIKSFPEIKNWAISGHSLGGVMAADYAYKNPSKIKALILFASYPQNSNNFISQNIKVLSLYGSQDGVANKDKILSAKSLYPSGTEIISISGGNHCQFGNYGFQSGDNKAAITEEEQQSIASDWTIKLLYEISK